MSSILGVHKCFIVSISADMRRRPPVLNIGQSGAYVRLINVSASQCIVCANYQCTRMFGMCLFIPPVRAGMGQPMREVHVYGGVSG